MSETVFILGAGASKDAGAPLMADFLDKADELRKNGDAADLVEDFNRVFEIISNLQNVHSKSQLDLDNIESVFAAFEMGKLINKLPGISPENIDWSLVSIKRLICRTLEKTIKYPVGERVIHPTVSYDSFARLVRKINDDGRQNKCSIITFNYDLALDYALHYHRHPGDYNLSNEPVREGYVSLLKLHGSLNWGRCVKCGEIIPWEFSEFFKKISFDLFSETEYVHLNLASLLSKSLLKYCSENISYDPVIVPPTWNKTSYQQGLSNVWSKAASELSDAENIIISGYSLTETDSFFRYLFALGSEGSTRIKRFWIFDPDSAKIVENRFRTLMGLSTMARFQFFNKTFREAIHIIENEIE